MIDYVLLSKEIAYALRHNPDKYGLVLDSEGWTDFDLLFECLKKNKNFKELAVDDVETMISMADKKRFEIIDNKIRAVYGHSVAEKIIKQPSIPPTILYHGTASWFIKSIKQQGLISKGRQYVHLSEDLETAIMVGNRRDSNPIILKIEAFKAHEQGINFYFVDDKIWLADDIPAQYVEKIMNNDEKR